MITLQQAIEIATEAHEGQYRKRIKVFPLNEHTLTNYELSKLLQNNGTDFTICKEDGEYSMNIHLELLIAKPYITHPLAVMEMMGTEEEKIVAVLHDVFEDNKNFTLEHNRPIKESEVSHWIQHFDKKYTITSNLYDALLLLTKTNRLSYLEYIDTITLSNLATKIKIADMMHNMSETTNSAQKDKYLKALPTLLKGL